MSLPAIPAEHHPEFPWGVDSLIANGVLLRLQQDPLLAAAGWSVSPRHMEDLLLEDTYSPPEIAVILEANEEVPKGSNRRAQVTSLLEIYLVNALQSKAGTETWYLARLIDHIKALLQHEAGRLEDANGDPLNCGLVQFQRVPGALRVSGGRLIARRLRVAYQSTIQQESRAWT